MMGDRTLREPANYVLWTSAGLLAIVLGGGVAFASWDALHRLAGGTLLDAGVTCISVGLAVLGLTIERPFFRSFFVVFAMTLLAAFLLGGPAFARIAP